MKCGKGTFMACALVLAIFVISCGGGPTAPSKQTSPETPGLTYSIADLPADEKTYLLEIDPSAMVTRWPSDKTITVYADSGDGLKPEYVLAAIKIWQESIPTLPQISLISDPGANILLKTEMLPNCANTQIVGVDNYVIRSAVSTFSFGLKPACNGSQFYTMGIAHELGHALNFRHTPSGWADLMNGDTLNTTSISTGLREAGTRYYSAPIGSRLVG